MRFCVKIKNLQEESVAFSANILSIKVNVYSGIRKSPSQQTQIYNYYIAFI